MVNRGLRFSSLVSVCIVFSGILSQACVRDLLSKYQQPFAGSSNFEVSQAAQKQSPVKGGIAEKNQPNIYAVNEQTIRFRLPFQSVWDGAIEVLLKNYNLNIVDQKSGVITTEWDSFYLGEHIYRNKVSVRIKRVSWDLVDLVAYNNVEVLQTDKAAGPSVWLPTNQGPQEIGRIIQNMAIALRQAPPVLPQSMMAVNQELDKKSM